MLRRLSRPIGTYHYRINGEVFPGISLSGENTETVAARQHRLLTSPITVGSATIPLQVRVAACQYPAHGATIRALLDHLQSAIRFSNESGRNIVLYSDTLDELLRTEALVRLPDGQGGYYSAGQVISLAERNGLVEELGDYVLCAACAFMRTRGHALGLGRISVNLSVQQLLVGNSAEHLLHLIRTSGVAPTGSPWRSPRAFSSRPSTTRRRR